jgi:porin
LQTNFDATRAHWAQLVSILPCLLAGAGLLAAARPASVFAASGDSVARETRMSAWQSGATLTLDGTAALTGGVRRGASFHGGALGFLEWSPATPLESPLTLGGYASVLSLFGRGPTEKLIGDALTASNLEGHRSPRLYSWWLQGDAADWQLRAGALLADEEFAGTVVGGNFINSSFGWPAFVSANTLNTGPAFFVAAAGIRLRYARGEAAYWQLGVYDGDTFDSVEGDPTGSRHGTRFRLGGEQGWFMASEVGAPFADGRTVYKVGGWFHTATFADQYQDSSGQSFRRSGAEPRSHSGNFGLYAAVERTLVDRQGKAGQVEAHLRGGVSPRDRNAVGFAADTGIAITGLVPARPADIFAIGVAAAKFSRVSQSLEQAASGEAPPDFEAVGEVGYIIPVSDYITLHSSLQYIRQPGGNRTLDDAVAFIVRVGTRL